jgi:hypothetical protein
MGLSRSAAPPGIPQKIWDGSSALRSLCESAETDGHDILRILDDLNTFGRIRQQHRTALIQERHRLGDMLESVANIAAEEIASGMSPSQKFKGYKTSSTPTSCRSPSTTRMCLRR